ELTWPLAAAVAIARLVGTVIVWVALAITALTLFTKAHLGEHHSQTDRQHPNPQTQSPPAKNVTRTRSKSRSSRWRSLNRRIPKPALRAIAQPSSPCAQLAQTARASCAHELCRSVDRDRGDGPLTQWQNIGVK